MGSDLCKHRHDKLQPDLKLRMDFSFSTFQTQYFLTLQTANYDSRCIIYNICEYNFPVSGDVLLVVLLYLSDVLVDEVWKQKRRIKTAISWIDHNPDRVFCPLNVSLSNKRHNLKTKLELKCLKGRYNYPWIICNLFCEGNLFRGAFTSIKLYWKSCRERKLNFSLIVMARLPLKHCSLFGFTHLCYRNCSLKYISEDILGEKRTHCGAPSHVSCPVPQPLTKTIIERRRGDRSWNSL